VLNYQQVDPACQGVRFESRHCYQIRSITRRKAILRRLGCNLIAPELADEWLQARNALSIEIFFGNTRFRRSPRRLRLKASFTASSGGIEPSLSSVRLCSLRGNGE